MNNHHSTLYILIFLFALTGCAIGGRLDNVHTANNPSGEHIRIQLNNQHFVVGELLAVNGHSIFMLTNIHEVAQVHIDSIDHAILGRNQKIRLIRNTIPPKQLQNYRYSSRYPQGINEKLLENLLQAYQKEELIVFGGI